MLRLTVLQQTALSMTVFRSTALSTTVLRSTVCEGKANTTFGASATKHATILSSILGVVQRLAVKLLPGTLTHGKGNR